MLSLMVEPAVGKYLEKTHPGVYVVNAKHPLGSWLIHSLAPKKYAQRVDPGTDWFRQRGQVLTHEFQFMMPAWCFQQIGTFIPVQKMVYFNRFVLNLMYTELMMNIAYRHGYMGEDGVIQEVIEKFRGKYDIYEKEFPDERLRKKYLRLRKNLSSAEFASSFSPGELLWRM
ncbi:hypothetical protein [Runella zeae]|uniref:hypothetical protein n=1 Tax=Runella zeae TaxID=94255 RepID=UPI002353B3AF|nr:hypothetical protein [Runella zeae]